MYAEIKDCPGFIITRNGVVFNTVKGQIVASFIRNGYKCVRTHNKSFYVHRLLAQAFIPNPKNKPCVNHIDGKKLNDDLDNLEWCTYGENAKHAYKTKLRYPRGRSPVRIRCVEEDLVFDSIAEAASYFGVTDKAVYRHLEGDSKTCHGYHWERITNSRFNYEQ